MGTAGYGLPIMLRRRLLAPILLASIGAAIAPASGIAAPRPCEFRPPPGVSSTAKRAAGGHEQTERYADGSYAVTRCAIDGRLRSSQTVERVKPGGPMVVTSRTIPQGQLLRTSSLSLIDGAPARAARLATAPPPPTPGKARVRAIQRAAAAPVQRPDPCRPAATFETSADGGQPVRWPGASPGYDYEINTASAAYANTSYGQLWVTPIVEGHEAWDASQNRCGQPDTSSLDSRYLGTTSARTHPEADGRNVVDFGPIEEFDADTTSAARAYSATWWRRNASGVYEIVETDQRYRLPTTADPLWTVGGRPGLADLRSVATHESGHSIGLRHVPDDSQVMGPRTFRGSILPRLLSGGDLEGLNALYG